MFSPLYGENQDGDSMSDRIRFTRQQTASSALATSPSNFRKVKFFNLRKVLVHLG